MRRTGPATRYRKWTCSGVSTSTVLSSATRFSRRRPLYKESRVSGAAAYRDRFVPRRGRGSRAAPRYFFLLALADFLVLAAGFSSSFGGSAADSPASAPAPSSAGGGAA